MTTTPIYTGPTGPASSGPSKLLIALISVGGVLLLAIVAIVFLILGQNSGGPGTINAGEQTPSPVVTSPPATPVAEPTDEATDDNGTDDNTDSGNSGQAPVDNSLRFTSFDYDKTVECDTTGEAEEKAQPSISWSSANAVKVYWTPSDKTATADNGYKVDSSGDQYTMSESKGEGERYEFPCNHRETFDTTITIYGADGSHVSKHVTFRDVNWNTGGSDDEED
jgi:hypothetical protein